MMTKLLLASLLFASAAAAQTAPTPPPAPPPAPSPHAMRAPDLCREGGDILFEIDHEVNASVTMQALPTSQIVLYATGAWHFESHDGNGKLLRSANGCFSNMQMQAIRADLSRATWTVKQAQAACMAISADFTTYSVHGQLVWTARMCQLDYLDETSAKSLAEIEKMLDDASAPRTPPCCKK